MATHAEIALRLGKEIDSLKKKAEAEPDRRLRADYEQRIAKIKELLQNELPKDQEAAAKKALTEKVEKANNAVELLDIDTEFNLPGGQAYKMKMGGTMSESGTPELPQHGLFGWISQGAGQGLSNALQGNNSAYSQVQDQVQNDVMSQIHSQSQPPVENTNMNVPQVPMGYKMVNDAYYAAGGEIPQQNNNRPRGIADWVTELLGNAVSMSDPMGIGYGEWGRRTLGDLIGQDAYIPGVDQFTDARSGLDKGVLKGAVNSLPFGNLATSLGRGIGQRTNNFFGNNSQPQLYAGQDKLQGISSGIGQIGGAVGAGVLSGGSLTPYAIGSGMQGAGDIFSNVAYDNYGNMVRPGWNTAGNVTQFASAFPGMFGGDPSKAAMNFFGYGGDLPQNAYGGIHIKPSHKGRFTKWAQRQGMSVPQAANHVMAHSENYSPSVVKMANFAKNARSWGEYGGEIPQNGYFDSTLTDAMPSTGFGSGVPSTGFNASTISSTATGGTGNMDWLSQLGGLFKGNKGKQTLETAGQIAPMLYNAMLMQQPSSYIWNPFYNANEDQLYQNIGDMQNRANQVSDLANQTEYYSPAGALTDLNKAYSNANKVTQDMTGTEKWNAQLNLIGRNADKRNQVIRQYEDMNRQANSPSARMNKLLTAMQPYNNIFNTLHGLGAERTAADQAAFEWNNRVDAAKNAIGTQTAHDISQFSQGNRNNRMMGNALDMSGMFYGYDPYQGIVPRNPNGISPNQVYTSY